VRVPEVSARILSVDAAAAAAADPEVVVCTAADLGERNAVKLLTEDWPVLAGDRICHAYEPVALVAAPTRERAAAAARAVKVETEPLPAVLTIDDALRGDPRTGGELNVLAECKIDRGDVEAALASAEVVVEGTYGSGHHEQLYIEPQGMVGTAHKDGSMEVFGSLQCPYFVHKALCWLFELEDDRVRVVQSPTGGGFGGKEDFPDALAAHVLLLSRKCGHPVKIVYDRHEDLIATPKRHPSRTRVRTGHDKDGTLRAMDVDFILDGGAYVTLSGVVLSRGVLHAGGPYRCPNTRVHGRALATNTVPSGAFRGFGAPQSQLAIERHLDRAARVLNLDPAEIRARNAYRPGDTTGTGQILHESVSAEACLSEAMERSDYLRKWRRFEAAREARSGGDAEPMRGVGLSLFWHGAGFTGNGERRLQGKVALRLAGDGTLEVLTASTEIGQGTDTVFAQIAAEASGAPPERVRVAEHDTRFVPDSGPTVASRTVMIVGGIVAKAAARVGSALAAFVAERRGLPPEEVSVAGGKLLGPDWTALCSFEEAAADFVAARGELVIEETHRPAGDAAFDEETYTGDAYPVFGWGCNVVEVSVDPDTLQVRPERVTAVVDVGKAVNPVLCRGQIEGGTLQSVAWGYLEEIKLAEGRYLNDRLQTYIIPTTRDAPPLDVVLLENPASCGPFGAKGIGELPMDGGAPALLAAVENATGLFASAVPATPERLLEAMREGRTVDSLRAREESSS